MVRIARQSQAVTTPIKAALFRTDPRCHWCGIETHWNARGLKGSPNLATLDHVKARWQCRSREEYVSADNHVLACQECNVLRDRIEQQTSGERQRLLDEGARIADAKELAAKFGPTHLWAC